MAWEQDWYWFESGTRVIGKVSICWNLFCHKSHLYSWCAASQLVCCHGYSLCVFRMYEFDLQLMV